MTTKNNKNPNLKKILINMPVKLVDDLEKYADSMNINRTAAILSLLSQALNNYKAIEYMEKAYKFKELEEKNG